MTLYPRQIVLRLEGGMPLRRGTYSRASTAVRKTRPQLVETVASGVPRTEWLRNAQTGLYEPHYLFQGARTNVCLRPREFDNAAWTKINAPVITPNDAVAPDGTITADKIDDDSATLIKEVRQEFTIANDGATHVIGVFLRKATTGPVARYSAILSGGAGVTAEVYVDPRNGSKITTSGVANSGVIDYNDSWWFCWLAVTNNTSGNTNLSARYAPAVRTEGDLAAAAGLVEPTGFNHFWGAEVILNASFPNIGFPDGGGSTFAQAADQFSAPLLHRPQLMWGYLRLRRRALGASARRLIQIGKADNSNPRLVVHDDNGLYKVVHLTPAGSVESAATVAAAFDDDVELLWDLSDDGRVRLRQAFNGGPDDALPQSGPLALVSAWSDTLFWVNSIGTSSAGAHAYRRIVVALGDSPASIAQARDWIMAR